MERILCAAIWFKDGNKYEHQTKNVDSGFVVCDRRHQVGWELIVCALHQANPKNTTL